MTVFVGPSNTGKSYLAMLIYAVEEALAKENGSWIYFEAQCINDKIIEKNISNNETTLSSIVEIFFEQWTKVMSQLWMKKIDYCFGEMGENLLDNNDSNCQVTVADTSGQLVLDLAIPSNSRMTSTCKQTLVNELKNVKNNYFCEMLKAYQNHTFRVEKFIAVFYIMITDFFSKQFFDILMSSDSEDAVSKAHYIPATRGGLMQSHRTLIDSVLQRMPIAGLDQQQTVSPFNGVLADFIRKLIAINGDRTRTKNSNLADTPKRKTNKGSKKIITIGETAEKNIMHGEIAVNMSETGYPSFSYRFGNEDNKTELPLMSSSSMVSELAPITLFIRYHVSPGDLFIVEEPEAHLHPAAQRTITAALVELANAGVRVLLTTHSDNVLEQIGNFMHAAVVNQKIKGQNLPHEKIDVHWFKKPRNRGTTKVKISKYDDRMGILTDDHLDVSSGLYEETVGLLNLRSRQKENRVNETDI